VRCIAFALFVVGLVAGCGPDDKKEEAHEGPFPADKIAPSGIDPARAAPPAPDGAHPITSESHPQRADHDKH
jgi:hypothetical protein